MYAGLYTSATFPIKAPVVKNPVRSLYHTTYDRIKQDIVSGRRQPGEPLFEEDLAQSLQVSRTPVREALRRLNHEGLVRIVPNKGAFVRVLTLRDIREIYEVREALESFAAGQAALRMSPEPIRRLSQLAESLKRRKNHLGFRDLRDSWEMLRQAITAAADNERLNAILKMTNEQVETARHYSSAPPGRIEELLLDFLSVVKAIKARDKNRAAKALQLHLRRSKEILLDMFEHRKEGRKQKPKQTTQVSSRMKTAL
jgi:DNA-binding GntR family transcriptional regulator